MALSSVMGGEGDAGAVAIPGGMAGIHPSPGGDRGGRPPLAGRVKSHISSGGHKAVRGMPITLGLYVTFSCMGFGTGWSGVDSIFLQVSKYITTYDDLSFASDLVYVTSAAAATVLVATFLGLYCAPSGVDFRTVGFFENTISFVLLTSCSIMATLSMYWDKHEWVVMVCAFAAAVMGNLQAFVIYPFFNAFYRTKLISSLNFGETATSLVCGSLALLQSPAAGVENFTATQFFVMVFICSVVASSAWTSLAWQKGYRKEDEEVEWELAEGEAVPYGSFLLDESGVPVPESGSERDDGATTAYGALDGEDSSVKTPLVKRKNKKSRRSWNETFGMNPEVMGSGGAVSRGAHGIALPEDPPAPDGTRHRSPSYFDVRKIGEDSEAEDGELAEGEAVPYGSFLLDESGVPVPESGSERDDGATTAYGALDGEDSSVKTPLVKRKNKKSRRSWNETFGMNPEVMGSGGAVSRGAHGIALPEDPPAPDGTRHRSPSYFDVRKIGEDSEAEDDEEGEPRRKKYGPKERVANLVKNVKVVLSRPGSEVRWLLPLATLNTLMTWSVISAFIPFSAAAAIGTCDTQDLNSRMFIRMCTALSSICRVLGPLCVRTDGKLWGNKVFVRCCGFCGILINCMFCAPALFGWRADSPDNVWNSNAGRVLLLIGYVLSTPFEPFMQLHLLVATQRENKGSSTRIIDAGFSFAAIVVTASFGVACATARYASTGTAVCNGISATENEFVFQDYS